MKKPLAAINGFSREEFRQHFGTVVEHAPWVAEQAWLRRPFSSRQALHDAMCAVVAASGEAVWAQILNAHPELSGKEAEAGTLTDFSTREQAGIGLDRLSTADFQHMRAFNRSYREKFGFPFVVCVRKLPDLAALFAEQQKRMERDRAAELQTGIENVCAIAALRLADLVEAAP